MAEFGAQDMGVFNKEKVDLSLTYHNYAYNDLTYLQRERLKNGYEMPELMNYPKGQRAPVNPFRCMGVDWDVNTTSRLTAM